MTKKQHQQRDTEYAAALIHYMRAVTRSRSRNAGYLTARYPGDAEYDYIAGFIHVAKREMLRDANARRRWQIDTPWRRRVLTTPIYARSEIFGDDLPPLHRVEAARQAGRIATASEEIKKRADTITDFGRSRNIGHAKNQPSAYAQTGTHRECIVVDHGAYSSRCRYTRFTYHAVYCAIENPRATEMYIVLPTGESGRAIMCRGSWHCRALQLSHIASQRACSTPPLRPEQQVRVLRHLIAQAGRSEDWAAEYDAGGLCIIEKATGEIYHTGGFYVQNAQDAFLQRARARAQAKRNKLLDSELDAHGSAIWVVVEDSITSGNCEIGTAQFVQELSGFLKADGELGAATAEAILALRDDSYTRRACRVAATRVNVRA